MRNLKRALSLALASVMLLGMMVVGTSAASTSNFTDADKIVNAEAVDLTTGLDIFKGYTDGSFGPDKAVSRAEAAVVIAKILHGSDVNPKNFAGAGKFNDVAPWAEGYVNLVASLGIIVGVGENQFAPDRTVSTVEFSTMLLKALGYYVEADALGADWMLEVTSKANALGLYGDLELSMTAPLTRENVAVMTMNALFAQRVAYDDVRGLYVKNSDRNVVVTNGTVDEYNTLAQNTYGLYAVEGLVVANGAMDINLEGKTEVVFEDAKDVTGDKYVEESYKFEVETGLDMIGHAATVYYTIEKKAPVVYAIVDDATLVVEAFMQDNLTTLAKNKGFDRDTTDTVVVYNYQLGEDYVVDHEDYDSYPAILISNSADKSIDYAIILDQELDYITKVTVDNSDEEDAITMYTGEVYNYDDDANAVVIDEVEKNDYVIVTYVAATETYIVETAPVETAMLTEVDRSRNSADTAYTTSKLYTEGTAYTKTTAVEVKDALNLTAGSSEDYAIILYADVLVEGEYILVYDNFERLIGVAEIEADKVVNAAYAAQFGYKINTAPSLNDKYALTVDIYFADGTNAVYYVDNTDGIFDDVKVDADGKLTKDDKAWTVSDVKNLNDLTGVAYGNYIKLWDVDVDADDKTVVIEELDGQKIDTTTKDIANAGVNLAGKIDQIKKGVTWMGATSKNDGKDLYGNSETMFWFVDGSYTAETLVVGTVTGMANVPTVDLVNTKDADSETGFVAQAAATQKDGAKHAMVDTVLVDGYEYDTAVSGIYYYNGKYTVTRVAAGEYTLTYKVYDLTTGELVTFTYDGFDTDADARKTAADKAYGYYEDNGKDIEQVKKGDAEYVIRSLFTDYIDLGDTLTLYTAANVKGNGVTIDENTLFVDLTSNNIANLDDLDTLITKNQDTWDAAYASGAITEATLKANKVDALLSYVYDDEDNLVDVIYVCAVDGKYTKDYADLNGSTEGDASISNVTLANKGGNFEFSYTMDKAIKDTDITVTIYKINNFEGDSLVATKTYSKVTMGAISWSEDMGVAVPADGNYIVEMTMNGATVSSAVTFLAKGGQA